MRDTDLQAQCVEFVSLSGIYDVQPALLIVVFFLETDPPKISDIFRLLCSLEPGLTVKDLCLRNDPNLFGIDERSVQNLHTTFKI